MSLSSARPRPTPVSRARIQIQRVIEAERGFIVTTGLCQRIADIIQIWRPRAQTSGLVVDLERIFKAPQPVQGCAEILQIVSLGPA